MFLQPSFLLPPPSWPLLPPPFLKNVDEAAFSEIWKKWTSTFIKKAFVSLERGREGERTDPPMKRRKKPFLNLKWCYFFQPSTQLPGKSKRAYILELMAAAVASPLFRCLNFTLCKKYPTPRR